MIKSNINPREIFESIFSCIYLFFIFTASLIFFINSSKNSSILLFGLLSFSLGLGDSFHLIPRILIAIKGNSAKLQWFSSLGLFISSITMTIFYIILFYIWKTIFPNIKILNIIPILLWSSALLRVILCFFPQNNWFSSKGNLKWSIYRNLPFTITGFCDFYLFSIIGSTNFGYLIYFAPAILISFACYFPVILFSKKIPAIGMLMIPKTIAYIFMISLGLFYLGKI